MLNFWTAKTGNVGMDKHAFHDVLAGDWSWVDLFHRWEELYPQIQDLERQRTREIMQGDRSGKLRHIYRELARLRAQISECQPAERYLFNEAKVILDTWKEFVDHWRRLQHKAAWAIGPSGQKLRDDQKSAWETLKIGSNHGKRK
jgi:hypothetical protein